MGFKVEHEHLSLEKARFVMPGSVMGEHRNPLEARGAALVAEIARTGWNLPGIEVEVDAQDVRGEVLRRVWAVSFATPEGDLRLTFGNRCVDGAYGLAGAEIGNTLRIDFYDDGSGKKEPRDVDFVCKAIDEVTERLRSISSMPGHDDVTEEGDAVLRRLCHVEPVPVPEGFPVLYAWADSDEGYRLAGHGDQKPTYGLSGLGWRLASLGLSDNPLHTNSYTYASSNPKARASQVVYAAKDECLPVEIRLRWLNDVYVVDNGAFADARQAAFKAAEDEGRDRITDRELNECIMATARTIVPWSEYKGGFADPVVVIGRRTALDEVRLMRGPITVGFDGDCPTAVMIDSQTRTPMQLARARGTGVGVMEHVERIARDAADVLGVPVKPQDDFKERLEAGLEKRDHEFSSVFGI